MGQRWYHPPPPDPCSQRPSFYKKQQIKIKKIKGKKKKRKKSPPPPNWACQHATDFKSGCVCVGISVCVQPWPQESLITCEDWCACGSSMGVRATPSISSPEQTPLPRDSRCSSSVKTEKKNPQLVLTRRTKMDASEACRVRSTHRHLL